MRIPERICLLLNHVFPRRKRKGRGSPQDYSRAQYEWAKKSLSFFEGFIDFNDKVVLDAGCGPGGKTVYFSQQGCRQVIGVDLDEERIQYAREFAAEKKAGITFRVEDLSQLTFPADTFDYIFMDDVIEHLRRPILEKALSECRRVLKPGGRLCVEFPPWTSFDASHLYDFIYTPWCQLIFSDKTLLNVVKHLNPPPPPAGKLSNEEHYLELNRITIKESKQLFKKLDFKIEKFDLEVLLRICLFKYLPVLSKYLTRRVVAVLSK